MQTFLLPLFGLMALGSASLSYPVFGTKRYTRANLLPANDYGSSLTMPVYSPIPQQYYDSQPPPPPQYLPMPSYSMGPAAAASDYYDDSGYYNSNYYYVPPVQRRHQRFDRYPSYGLPTFQGEYKPTPYYYAHAPSYSYSDDRESNNPLDDLHEEMLQEDERERARDFMPVGQEQWYESPSRHPVDNAFLRNLIMYNNQMNSLRNKPFESNEDYEEYEDPEPEYYDTSYGDNRNSYSGYVNPYTGGSPTTGSSSSSTSRNMLNKITSLRNSMAKNAVEDDEEVQELKSLIHQQKNSRLLQQQQQLLQQQPQPQSSDHQTPSPLQDMKQQQQRSLVNDYQQYSSGDSSWQHDSPSYSTYDYDNENEYDDSWSHWDRKRNVQPKKVILPVATTSQSPSTTTTTTTTEKPKIEILQGRNGQKEVVLPRPASPVRNPFANVAAAAVASGLHQQKVAASRPLAINGVQGKASSQVQPKVGAGVSSSNKSVYDTIKKIISMQQNLEDTELSQQLDSQRHKGTRVHKRFVSTAEALVQQLDGLKRTA